MLELPPGSGVEEHAQGDRRSFARGLIVALPLSIAAWLIFIFMM